MGFISLGGGLASPGAECYVIIMRQATPSRAVVGDGRRLWW